MEPTCEHRTQRYAFLAIVEVDQLGHCGGLLVLSSRGRPLEFHCTAPVNANRAQQILYGETLEEFLCCDQIGATLVEKAKVSPDLVFVEDRRLFPLAELLNCPVILVTRNSHSHEVDSHDSNTHESDSHDSELQHSRGRILEIEHQQFEVCGQATDVE